MKRNKVLIVVTVALSALVIALGIGFGVNTALMNNHANTINSMYERSFYELVNNVNDIEVNLSKLMVTEDYASQQKTLTNLVQKTVEAQNNLSMLPLKENSITSTTSFINSLNGYCTSMLNYKVNKISSLNFDTLEELYDYVVQIKVELNGFSRQLSNGYNIMKSINSSSDNMTSKFKNISNDSVEYPTLIYDGPFSDSVLNKEVKGLPSNECTKEDAREFIYEKFQSYGIREISYVSTTKGKFETFDYNLILSNNIKYFIQVTKKGMFLLTISGVANHGDAVKTNDECVKIAEDFVTSLGLSNMKAVWQAASNGIFYVNLVYMQNDVMIYPDMIKVKIDMTSGYVMGWEASSYAYNHITRSGLNATVGAVAARNLISSKITVQTQKLCIVPNEYIGETLAYEFCGSYNGKTYYIYINALTGEQINVLRVIETDDGDLLL